MTTAADQTSPVFRLTERFAGLLSQSREDLVHLSGLHPDFVTECFAALSAKKERLQTPLMGELYPHVVAQGLRLGDIDRRTLAAAWLALYGYICIVDYQLDQKGHLNGRSSLAASALLGWGVATIGRYTSGTPYANVFLDNINRAFSGQYVDILVRGNEGADRERSDMDKNRALVAALAGYCAAAREPDDRLIRSAEAVLAPMQVFDDLQDLQEDYDEDNMTVFVRIVRECASSAASLTQSDMYRALISDPRAQRILMRAAEGLEQSLLILDFGRDRVVIDLLCELKHRNDDLIRALDEFQHDPPRISEPEVMRRIEQIAASC